MVRAAQGLLDSANAVILGKEAQIRQALACLLAQGHLLIEDLPGVGKTTLTHLLARLLGLHFQRIQFTSDLLPADIIGASIYERETGGFTFHPGPIFSQVFLADEVNRATPKTQSALLAELSPALTVEELTAMQARATRVHTAEALIDYVQSLLEHTRRCGAFRVGLSPRAGLALVRAAQAWALLDNRDAVLPEDVQAVFPAVAGHRLQAAGDGHRHAQAERVLQVINDVAV